MQFLIEADKPYPGHCLSFIAPDGTVAYSGGLTVEQYEKREGIKLRVVEGAELEQIEADYIDSRCTAPTPIDAERWQYALEVLPPSKWRHANGVESFHISERITGDLVSWFAQVGGRYFTFDDRSKLTAEQVAERVLIAL